jgi:lysylphosphatidylglycerol synthetase-like protein (DUF2156 family)
MSTPTIMVASMVANDDEARRRRIRRTGLLLLGSVIVLAALTVGYVLLFGHVLRDPEHPPSVTSSRNPRVFLFEIVVGGVAVVVVTALVAWKRRRDSR